MTKKKSEIRPHYRTRLIFSGTPKNKPVDTTPVNTGRPELWGSGTPISLGRDNDGRDVIFWSRGTVSCQACDQARTYVDWRAHMRPYALLQATKGGGQVIRRGLRCPMVSYRDLLHLGT